MGENVLDTASYEEFMSQHSKSDSDSDSDSDSSGTESDEPMTKHSKVKKHRDADKNEDGVYYLNGKKTDRQTYEQYKQNTNCQTYWYSSGKFRRVTNEQTKDDSDKAGCVGIETTGQEQEQEQEQERPNHALSGLAKWADSFPERTRGFVATNINTDRKRRNSLIRAVFPKDGTRPVTARYTKFHMSVVHECHSNDFSVDFGTSLKAPVPETSWQHEYTERKYTWFAMDPLLSQKTMLAIFDNLVVLHDYCFTKNETTRFLAFVRNKHKVKHPKMFYCMCLKKKK